MSHVTGRVRRHLRRRPPPGARRVPARLALAVQRLRRRPGALRDPQRRRLPRRAARWPSSSSRSTPSATPGGRGCTGSGCSAAPTATGAPACWPQTRMHGSMLTEDIDSTLRVLAGGRQDRLGPGADLLRARADHAQALWNQRVRWAQGWFQVSRKHLRLTFASPDLSAAAEGRPRVPARLARDLPLAVAADVPGARPTPPTGTAGSPSSTGSPVAAARHAVHAGGRPRRRRSSPSGSPCPRSGSAAAGSGATCWSPRCSTPSGRTSSPASRRSRSSSARPSGTSPAHRPDRRPTPGGDRMTTLTPHPPESRPTDAGRPHRPGAARRARRGRPAHASWRATAALSALTIVAFHVSSTPPRAAPSCRSSWRVRPVRDRRRAVPDVGVPPDAVLRPRGARRHLALPAREFLFRRAVRIVPLYWIAVTTVWALRNPALPGDWRDLVEHLLFVQVFDRERIFYTLGPTWSMSLEVMFYLSLVVLGAARGEGLPRHRLASPPGGAAAGRHADAVGHPRGVEQRGLPGRGHPLRQLAGLLRPAGPLRCLRGRHDAGRDRGRASRRAPLFSGVWPTVLRMVGLGIVGYAAA